jgi:hypothetical protein
MPTGIYRRTKDHNRKNSEANKGKVPWNKGKTNIYSDETKAKLRIAKLGTSLSEKTRNKISNSNKGHFVSMETRTKIGNKSRGRIFSKNSRKKMSESHKNKHPSIETRKKNSKALKGEKSYLWKGGITSENHKIRTGIKIRLWREKVFKRDDYTCQKYKVRGGELCSHHIKNFAQYPELRFKVSNGITLSEKAHKNFHKIYGHKNNTKKQLYEYVISS